MEEYLVETSIIDYMNPHIQKKVHELLNQSEDYLDYIKRCYMFVRDEIPHSWDIKTDVVSKTASEVLEVNWVKSTIMTIMQIWMTDWLIF